MSIANLFQPNDLNLFCGTITSSSGGGGDDFTTINVSNQILMTTPAAHPIQIDLTSTTSEGDVAFLENGTLVFGVGDNVSTGESYIWNYANRSLKFGTNDVERLDIPAAGIVANTTPTLLGLNGTALVSRNVSTLSSQASWNLATGVAITPGTPQAVVWDTNTVTNPNISLAVPGSV